MPPHVPVLIVGAGPTGLALAVQLARYGIRFRIVDRSLDRAHESRALAIQPRTLEVLANCGISPDLLAVGNRAVQLRLHTGRRVIPLRLFDIGVRDTAYPYLLFLAQAETERIFAAHLSLLDIDMDRGRELVSLRPDGDNAVATLRDLSGSIETVRASYVVGCDGPHSTVREQAGIAFTGSAYPQTFVLADVEADGIERGVVHAFLSGPRGPLLFFPLGTPATWRMIAMRAPGDAGPVDEPVTLARLQALTDAATETRITLHDPVWLTDFRVHKRGVSRYRAGGVFLAGDAAHIHSPAGGQGMNIGIQDAVNLGWKLALVLRHGAPPALLDTYEAERAPVGRAVRRFTDRAFLMITSGSVGARLARRYLVPVVLPVVLRSRFGRRLAFRTISELSTGYHGTDLAAHGPGARSRSPRTGDRLPDMSLARQPGGARSLAHHPVTTSLHALVAAPGWHLLLCGRGWTALTDAEAVGAPSKAGRPMLTVHRLRQTEVLRGLGAHARDSVQLLIRPDGYVGYRSDEADLAGLHAYLDRWLPGPG